MPRLRQYPALCSVNPRPGQQFQRGDALAGGRDVVIRAFHRLDGDLRDDADIHPLAVHGEFVLRDLAVLEDAFDGGQVEFRVMSITARYSS